MKPPRGGSPDFYDQIAYAKIALQTAGNVKELDCCASDAVTLAVQCQIPIYADEELLDKMGWGRDRERNLFFPLKQEALGPEQISKAQEGELSRLSAFREFVESLDLEDLGSRER